MKAFVVVHGGGRANQATTDLLQKFVKSVIAPYKYPRVIEYASELPRTATGKLQRYRLRS